MAMVLSRHARMDDKLSRRDLIHRSVAFGALAAFGAAACGKEKRPALSCNDTSGISAADAQLRTTLAYVDSSTEPGKSCTQCQQYNPAPSADVCGTCKILKGPVSPRGYCKSFVAKPT
jgi:hypothetical protein